MSEKMGGYGNMGFGPDRSLQSNLNSYYTYRHLHDNGGKGGGGGGGGGKRSFSIALIAVLTVIGLITQPMAVLILALLAGMIGAGVAVTHIIWNARCKGVPNAYFRRAAKIAAGGVSSGVFFLLMSLASPAFALVYVIDKLGVVMIIVGIILGIVCLLNILWGVQEKERRLAKEREKEAVRLGNRRGFGATFSTGEEGYGKIGKP